MSACGFASYVCVFAHEDLKTVSDLLELGF